MSWQVEWSGPASRDLRRLDVQTRERVYQAVHRFADTGYGDVRKLQGVANEWRLRVGEIRVRFVYVDPDVLRVLRVLPRDTAYRG